MMIYVFYVNRGDMLMFDSCLAVESVSKLQEVIYKDTDIPVECQVLLMSGGEPMSPDARVASYSAGMVDTCPIFLFNTKAIEEKNFPPISFDFGEFDHVRRRVEGSYDMAPTLATLSARTQLAMDLRDQSKKYQTVCKALVLDQHRQHQGWCTVVANLEDSLKATDEKTNGFILRYEQFLQKKPQQMEMLHSFPESYALLSRTPILESLTDILSKPEYQARFLDRRTPDTLVQFFTTLDNNQDLLAEAQDSIAELSQINTEQLARIKSDREDMFAQANINSLKEVAGLEKRLYTLEQLLVNTDKIVKDQTAYAQGFVHNLKRCKQLADPQLLPDLCISHKAQLRQMQVRDADLKNILVKCLETKGELCDNLHKRLRWVMFVENKLAALDGRIALQYENCRRLKLRIDMLNQIYRAPSVYAQLCVEVCRRRNSVMSYSTWSSGVFEKSTEWYDKEVVHRKEFYRSIGPHFLKEFFPKLDRLPQPIMSSPVRQLDEDLPPITREEINSLREALPELEQWLKLEDDALAIQVSPSLRSIGHSPLSPTMPDSPGTPSDIAILTPRTNQSSQSSVNIAKVLSPTTSTSSQTVEHSELSNMDASDVLTAKLELNDDIFKTARGPSELPSISALPEYLPGSDLAENALHPEGDTDYEEHLMARFESFDQDGEDISSATDDDAAPASWTEDYSGGFLTANFYMSDELESVSGARAISTDMANTITMQNGEIEKLLSENLSYKRKCDNLVNLIQHLAKSFQQELQNLKEKSALVREDLSSQKQDYDTFQASILTAVQKAPALQQRAVDAAIAGCEVSFDSKISELSANIKQMDLKTSELQQTIDELNLKNSELSSVVSEAVVNQQAEIESSAALITKRLTLEHELELDQVKHDSAAEMDRMQSEIEDRESKIAQLESEIKELEGQVTAHSALATRQMENYKTKAESVLEEKLAEAAASHELEKTNLHEEFKHTLEKEITEKLAELNATVAELQTKHELEMQALAKPTTDSSVNTDDDFLNDRLETLRADLEAEGLKSLAANTEQLELKFHEQLKSQEESFLEQSKQLKQSYDQELEYRATTMRDSLQQVSEMKSEQKFTKMKKEKDLIIAELKRQLTAGSPHRLPISSSITPATSLMAESVVTVDSSSESHPLEAQLAEKNDVIKTLQSQINSFKMSASSQDMLQNDKISVRSCRAGDKVILCYDEASEHYTVFSLLSMQYFVRDECIEEFNLELSDGNKKGWLVAEVVNKELCMTRKMENRFNLPINTKFYRVRVKPWAIQ